MEKEHGTISPLVFFAFLISFMEKNASFKVLCCFDHFSQTYEVAKFLMITLSRHK